MDVYYEVFCPDFVWGQVLSIHDEEQEALESLESLAFYRQRMWPGETVLARRVAREVLEF